MSDLIYGKAKKNSIVSIEVSDEFAEIFTQDVNGNITSEFVPNRYWLLFTEKVDSKCIRLNGNLDFKWGKQYTDRARFLKERAMFKNRCWSIYDPKEALMVKDGYCYFQGMKHTDLNVLSFDIETTGFDPNKDELLLISNTYRDSKGNITRRLFSYDDYEHASDMVLAWADWVCNDISPTVIVGHNVNSFDFPFLVNYCAKEGVAIPLGRNGSGIKINSYDSKFRIDGSREQAYNKVSIYGREIVDTYFLSIKHDVAEKKWESYGLKNIIKQEGMEVKGRTFYDASKIRENYLIPEEWEKIKSYCIFDSDDALNLYDLVSPAFFYQTQSIPKSYQLVTETATGSQLNSILVRSYLQNKHSVPKPTRVEDFRGGISFGVPGIYKNCLKLDIKSAYPS